MKINSEVSKTSFLPQPHQGEPKAIPWTHLTPLRCALDGWAHMDVRPGSRVCWPTSLGWMMGPWLLYTALLNGGTVALYGVSIASTKLGSSGGQLGSSGG